MAAYDPNDEDFKYLAIDRKKMLKEQTQAFDGKKNCWVPDDKNGFAAAEIQSTKGEEITVKLTTNNEVSGKVIRTDTLYEMGLTRRCVTSEQANVIGRLSTQFKKNI